MFAVLRFNDIITCGFGFTCAKALLVGLRQHITIQVVHSCENDLLGFTWEFYFCDLLVNLTHSDPYL